MALTLFTVPKPFVGDTATIQLNAIRSWQSLDPSCQVIVCGDEPGCRDVVAELRLDHIPEVGLTELGTPILSSVFELAEARARHNVVCYLNADLILFSDFLDSIERVQASSSDFLVVGQTTNLAVGDAEDDAGRTALRERARSDGALRGREWIDFFVFRRGRIGRLPDFAVGRPYWDNWLIWRARRLGMDVVDITPSALVVHQAHGYEHVPQSTGRRWEGPEADRNRELLGHVDRVFTLDECTHQLTSAGLVPYGGRGRIHRFGAELRLRPWARHLHRGLRGTYGLGRRLLRRDARVG